MNIFNMIIGGILGVGILYLIVYILVISPYLDAHALKPNENASFSPNRIINPKNHTVLVNDKPFVFDENKSDYEIGDNITVVYK